MIIRHAEKPGVYNNNNYLGIDALGTPDPDSLITLGWERAGGVANLFAPTNKKFQNSELATPDLIYAASPIITTAAQPNGSTDEDAPSQRPYQTISALAAKLGLSSQHLITTFKKNDYRHMVKHALGQKGTVLISWQHQDILPKKKGDDCVMHELLKQSDTPKHSLPVPPGPWPGDRYDMVFVLDRPSGKGAFTSFTQVPQLLLAGDKDTTFKM